MRHWNLPSDSVLVHTGYIGVSVPNPRINTNYILNKEHVRINLFSDTNDNKNAFSSLFSLYTFSVFVYTGFQNSATTLTLLCKHLLLRACDLSSNLIGQPVCCGAGKKSTHRTQKNPCIVMLPMIAPGVNGPIGIYFFNTKASLLRIFAFSVEKAFRVSNDDDRILIMGGLSFNLTGWILIYKKQWMSVPATGLQTKKSSKEPLTPIRKKLRRQIIFLGAIK